MGYTLDAYGKPVFSKTPTQTVVDMQAGADFTELFAWTRGGTAADRAALLPGQIRPGLQFTESDTGLVLRYDAATGWSVIGGVPVAGVIGSVPANRLWNTALTRVGKRVFIEGRVHTTGGGVFASNEVVGLLPAGFRPVRAEVFIGALGVTPAGVWSANSAYIQSTGSIQVNMQGVASVEVVGFTATWTVA